MKLERTTTGLIIRQPSDEIKRKCLRYFSLSNPLREYFIYSGNDPDKKSIFGKEKDVIYITSGFLYVKDEAIRRLPKPHSLPLPTPKKVSIEMNRQPRSKLQEDCIKKLTTSNSDKITVELKPGVGKTFIAIYSIAKLGLKPLIIAPTALLKNQWIENFTDLGFDKNDIATNIYDSPKKTFCVVTISAIENELRKDWDGLMKVIDKASFGIKVIDEAHLHLKGVLKFDAICNIKHNWYLSATLGRSDISEDNVLNRALLDADRFVGNNNYEEYQHEYVRIYFQDIYYHPSNKLCNQYFKYGSKGLVIATYYQMLMNYQNGRPFINNIINMTKLSKRICDYGKVLVLVPLLKTISVVKGEMDRDPFFRKFSISTVDGSMSQAEKRKALEKDIILSTTLSMGTGVDVPDLAVVINFDQKKSLIIGEQIFGRLRRRKDDRDCYYIDIADHVKQAKSIWHWASHRRIMMPYYPGAYRDIRRLPGIKC